MKDRTLAGTALISFLALEDTKLKLIRENKELERQLKLDNARNHNNQRSIGKVDRPDRFTKEINNVTSDIAALHLKLKEIRDQQKNIPNLVKNMNVILDNTRKMLLKHEGRVDVSQLLSLCNNLEEELKMDVNEASLNTIIEYRTPKANKIEIDAQENGQKKGFQLFETLVDHGKGGNLEEVTKNDKRKLDERLDKLRKLHEGICKNIDEVGQEGIKREKAKAIEVQEKQKRLELVIKVES